MLLLALEDYFREPSAEVLTRLYDAANAISLSGMPRFSRNERILLRTTDRKDMFEERFGLHAQEVLADPATGSEATHDESGGVNMGRLGSSSSSRGTSSAAGHEGLRKGSTGSSQAHAARLTTPPSREGRATPDIGDGRRKGVPRDTHFFETEAKFRRITVPIRIPTTAFDEDVGDVSCYLSGSHKLTSSTRSSSLSRLFRPPRLSHRPFTRICTPMAR